MPKPKKRKAVPLPTGMEVLRELPEPAFPAELAPPAQTLPPTAAPSAQTTEAALPPLKWVASPNFSHRHAAPIDLIVVHDCEGSYAGSINTFRGGNAGNPVSAHLVLREDGGEATQMVGFKLKAWHCVAFNSRSIGLEMAGFEAKGYAVAEWKEAACIVAYLCRRFGIPPHWARGGVGPGIARHYDLGAAGGGHHDPTTSTATWVSFLDLVDHAYVGAKWPAAPWGRD